MFGFLVFLLRINAGSPFRNLPSASLKLSLSTHCHVPFRVFHHAATFSQTHQIGVKAYPRITV